VLERPDPLKDPVLLYALNFGEFTFYEVG